MQRYKRREKIKYANLIGSIAAAREVGISLRQLYHWVNVFQVVKPRQRQCGMRVFKGFTCEDIECLKGVKQMIDQGYTLRAAVNRALSKQNHFSGDSLEKT